jgi:hypothetical protein
MSVKCTASELTISAPSGLLPLGSAVSCPAGPSSHSLLVRVQQDETGVIDGVGHLHNTGS